MPCGEWVEGRAVTAVEPVRVLEQYSSQRCKEYCELSVQCSVAIYAAAQQDCRIFYVPDGMPLTEQAGQAAFTICGERQVKAEIDVDPDWYPTYGIPPPARYDVQIVGSDSPPTYQGVREYRSAFRRSLLRYDTWTAGDIVFHAPHGQFTPDEGKRYAGVFKHADSIMRTLLESPDYDTKFRVPSSTYMFGERKKFVALTPTCGAGCGDQRHAEADSFALIPKMKANPTAFEPVWVLIYELARGGSNALDRHGYWPSNMLLLPHLLAMATLYDVEDPNIQNGVPGDIMASFQKWEESGLKYLDLFQENDMNTEAEGFHASTVLLGILGRVMIERDLSTLYQVVRNMRAKPEPHSARQGICDFQQSVNAATSGMFNEKMTTVWGLAEDCST